MPRHSKNNTAHSIFTYHERGLVKDCGTIKQRLGVDSMRKFEQCWLCLRSALFPVSTPNGYIFCRKCIILNLAEQKKNMIRQKHEWQKYQDEKKQEENKLKLIEEQKGIKKFLIEETQSYIDFEHEKSKKKDEMEPMLHDNASALFKSFWVAENTPNAVTSKIPKIQKSLVCPITQLPLKLDDLVELKCESADNDSESTQWLCSISKKPITHQKAVLIKETGQIMLSEYFEKFILGEKGYLDKVLQKKDVIYLQPGGTAFSTHNKVETQTYRPVME